MDPATQGLANVSASLQAPVAVSPASEMGIAKVLQEQQRTIDELKAEVDKLKKESDK